MQRRKRQMERGEERRNLIELQVAERELPFRRLLARLHAVLAGALFRSRGRSPRWMRRRVPVHHGQVAVQTSSKGIGSNLADLKAVLIEGEGGGAGNSGEMDCRMVPGTIGELQLAVDVGAGGVVLRLAGGFEQTCLEFIHSRHVAELA